MANPAIPLIRANIVWQGTGIGTATNALGDFVLQKQDAVTQAIVVTYIGYGADDKPAQESAYNRLPDCCKKGAH